MLYLICSPDTESCADDLIEKIGEMQKKDPLRPVQIIFADKKKEEWFRLYHVKKNIVSANLNCLSMSSFTEKLVTDGGIYGITDRNILKNLIHAVLVSDAVTENGETVPYYMTLPGLREYMAGRTDTDHSDIPVKTADLSSKLSFIFVE